MASNLPVSRDGRSIVNSDLSIPMGSFPGISHVNKFGAIASVGTAFEDIWHMGGTWVPLAAPTILDISSDSASDTIAGVGAQRFTIQGLDAEGLEISETVDLDGVTPVPTTKIFSAVNRGFVSQAGSSSSNVGDIYVADDSTAHTLGVPDTDASVQARILADEGQTQVARYTVPANKTAYMSTMYVLSGDNKTVTFEFYRYTDKGIRRIVFSGTVTDINFTKDYSPYVTIPSGWTITARAKVSVGTALVAGGMDLVLVENRLIG
jgi:hypothetical protein